MSETVWYTRKYICRNGVEERTKFAVRFSSSGSRQRKREAVKASRASDNAERQTARNLNNNFSEHHDIHLVLEYSEAGYSKVIKRAEAMREDSGEPWEDLLYRAAQKECENWIRRVQRHLKGLGELRYLFITADMDGDTGECVRLHHHVIINREAKEACIEKWQRMGFVMNSELYSIHGDFSPLASYLIKQVRYIQNAKRYTPSRNLIPPETTEPMVVTRFGESEMRVPKGCVELYRSPYIRGAAQYLRYLRTDRRDKGRAAAPRELRSEETGANGLPCRCAPRNDK